MIEEGVKLKNNKELDKTTLHPIKFIKCFHIVKTNDIKQKVTMFLLLLLLLIEFRECGKDVILGLSEVFLCQSIH